MVPSGVPHTFAAHRTSACASEPLLGAHVSFAMKEIQEGLEDNLQTIHVKPMRAFCKLHDDIHVFVLR
jgi:hypothetical protein